MISPLGHDLESSWAGLAAGKSGTGPITHWDAADFPTQICARVNDWEPQAYMDRREARRTGRATQFAWKATREALAMSGLDLDQENKARMGVEMGLAFGGWDIVEEQTLRMAEGGPRRFNPALAPAALISATPTFIAIQLGVTGPANSQVTACATGITALGEAARRVQRGDVDVMIAGGIEGYLSPLIITTFSRLGAGSTRNDDPEHACRPFSGDRDGMVVGEGAAVFILESLEPCPGPRGHHPGRVWRLWADRRRLRHDRAGPGGHRRGGLHGPGPERKRGGPHRDELDRGPRHGHPPQRQNGDRGHQAGLWPGAYAIPVTSIKSAIGHSMGAAGAQSAAVIVKAMQEGRILPTINYTEPDPDCDLDYVPNVSRAHRVDAGMCNGFGLGGQNASLVLKRFIE